MCENASDCVAIDFGKNGRSGECYKNTEKSATDVTNLHTDFDSYVITRRGDYDTRNSVLHARTHARPHARAPAQKHARMPAYQIATNGPTHSAGRCFLCLPLQAIQRPRMPGALTVVPCTKIYLDAVGFVQIRVETEALSLKEHGAQMCRVQRARQLTGQAAAQQVRTHTHNGM